MKNVFLLVGILFGIAQAHAMDGESRFRLLNMQCESEPSSGVETSPQSPPLDIDDPGTPGCNTWEINVLTSGDFTKGEKKFEMPLLDINYGIGDNLQLKYEVPMEKTQTESTSDSNVGNSKVGIKYMFFEDEDSKLQIAFYPQMDFVTSIASNRNKEEGFTGNVTTLPLLLSKKIGETKKGNIMLTANVGYNSSSRTDTQDSVFLSTGVGFPLLRNVSIMGEISTERALTKNADDMREELVKVNLGMLGTINKYLFLYGSFGESLVSSDHLSHTYALAGVRFLTGGIEK
jgi:hypothetical protein